MRVSYQLRRALGVSGISFQLLILMLLLGYGAGFAQQTVQVTVKDESAGEIAPLALTGFNYGNAMRVVGFEEAGIPVFAWEVGNEPDLYRTNRGDPSWTPEKYCRQFRAFAAALKGVDPDYLIAGPAVSGARPSGQQYLREVLFLCGDVIDILTWHIYPTNGTWTDAAALATSSQVTEEIRLYEDWLEDPETNPLGYERDTGMGITEFGLSWKSNNFRHLEDMTAALWLADALGQMATGGLDMSAYFALQGTGGHGLIGLAGWIRPTYYVYKMLADFEGQAFAVESGSPALNAYAAKSGDALRLLLVNRSLDDMTVSLELERGGLSEKLELLTLSEAIFDRELAYEKTEQKAAKPILVPAKSVVLVKGGVR